jgi:predicted nucleic acid-binding protein
VRPTIPAFIDSNVPIYATGRGHPLRAPCLEVIQLIDQHPDAFVTSVEVLQELLHHLLRRGLWPDSDSVLHDFMDLMGDRVEPIYATDVAEAGSLARRIAGIQSRDYLHAAVIQRLGLGLIVSADRGFDRLPLKRLDPADVGSVRAALNLTPS